MTSRSLALQRAAQLDSAAISDALDAAGLAPGSPGLRSMTTGARILGFARTASIEPAAPGPAGPHLLTEVVADSGADDVLLIDNGGRLDVSCWGGILGLGATARGIRGVVVEGACRDVEENRGLGLSVYARGSSPRTARGRVQQRASGEPVRIDGLLVREGDLVLHDETGFVAIPAEHIDVILAAAEMIVSRERRIAQDVRAGRPLPEAMHDARLAGEGDER